MLRTTLTVLEMHRGVPRLIVGLSQLNIYIYIYIKVKLDHHFKFLSAVSIIKVKPNFISLRFLSRM